MQKGNARGYTNQEVTEGENPRQYREEVLRLYKPRKHRGGRIGDNTERKCKRLYKSSSQREGGSATIQRRSAEAIQTEKAQTGEDCRQYRKGMQGAIKEAPRVEDPRQYRKEMQRLYDSSRQREGRIGDNI